MRTRLTVLTQNSRSSSGQEIAAATTDVTLRESQPRTELQRLLAQCQELGERILDLEEKPNGDSD